MRDLLSKLAKFTFDFLAEFWNETHRVTLNIALWLAYYFRGYEARIGAIFGGILVLFTFWFVYLLLGVFASWSDFSDGEVVRTPGRAKSGSSWLRKLVGTLILNGTLLYLIGHFIWSILLVLRHLPIYRP